MTKTGTAVDLTARNIEAVEQRSLEFERGTVDKEARTVELSFSSELPVQRWFGEEILDHAPDSCDLTRLNSGGPVLVEHNRGDQVGVIESAKIGQDRKGRATIRFGRSNRATEIFNDVVDGIRRLVSVSYEIKDMVMEKSQDGKETYRVTRWLPFEVSFVSVPADPTVGVGRAHNNKGTNTMHNIKLSAASDGGGGAATANPAPAAGVRIEVSAEDRQKWAKEEQKRAADILTLCSQHELGLAEAQRYIAEGKTIDEVRAAILETRYKAKPLNLSPNIGMSDREVGRYSLVRAIRQLANKEKLDGLEREASEATAKRLGKDPQGFFVPSDVSTRSLSESRALNVATATAGGFTVGTDVLGASMIELLRKRTKVVALGATSLSGLMGNVAIPKHSGGATAYWLKEDGTVTASQQTFKQLGLTPHRLAASTAYTKQLLAQSSIDIESFVRTDLATVLAIAKDLAAINGSGNAGQPMGLLVTSGLNEVTFGAAATWAKVLDFEKEIATDNADVSNMAWLTTAATRAKWKAAVKVTNQARFLWDENNTVNGYRAEVSEQVPSDKVIFGNWAELIIADWEGLDVVVNPYSLDLENQIRVTINLHCDIGIRHEESFCRSTDSGAQ